MVIFESYSVIFESYSVTTTIYQYDYLHLPVPYGDITWIPFTTLTFGSDEELGYCLDRFLFQMNQFAQPTL